jgi:lysophospholipase L1-like esterase
MFCGTRVRRLAAAGLTASCLALSAWSAPAGGPTRWWAWALGPKAHAAPPELRGVPAPVVPIGAPTGDPGPDPTPVWNLVGLGDSVLTRCSCPGVLADYADLVAEGTGRKVRVHNAATSGATSYDLAWALANREQLRAALRAAEAVVVFVGANDFIDAFDAVATGAAPSVLVAAEERLRLNLTGALTRIRQLVGPAVPVLVCGYWNDFEDGAVAARDYSVERRRAAAAATDATNEAIQRAATATGARYVSTAAAFADHPGRTDLLDPDGDHLSAGGARLVAAALLEAAY